jgi:hypothetical protein
VAVVLGEYEQALDVLLVCALRRRKLGGDLT